MVARKFERWKTGQVPDLLSKHLVNRDSGPNICGAFLQAHASEKDTTAARVIARTVGPWVRAFMIDAAEHLNQLSALLQWLKRRAQHEVIVFFGPP
jgi:hypothetical protein